MAKTQGAKPGNLGRPRSGRENLLKAALRVFAKNGFRKTTLDDIAREAGIAKSTLYNYFKDKADIYLQVCLYAALAWQDHVKAKVAQVEDPREKFLTLGRESFAYLQSHDDLRKLLQQDPELFPLFQKSKRYPEVDLEAENMLRDILWEGIQKGVFRRVPLEPATRLIFSMYRMFVVKTYLEHPEFGEDQLYETGLSIALDGITRY
jgi:AcrR family transcriptional regulator